MFALSHVPTYGSPGGGYSRKMLLPENFSENIGANLCNIEYFGAKYAHFKQLAV